MATAVTKFVNVKETGVRLTNAGKKLKNSRLFLLKAGKYIEVAIRTRTARGIDSDGASFKPYSESYARTRERAGLQRHPVNLFFTGAMMGALFTDIEKNTVAVYFRDTVDKKGVRNVDKAMWNQPTRDFLHIGKKESKEITKMAREFVKTAIKKK
jgi:hypothetical protein